MKRIITIATVLALGLTATACTESLPEGDTDRISYEIEAFYLQDGVTRSVLSQVHVVANIENLSGSENIHVRDGQTGAWLVLPWESAEDLDFPIRRQFTYDRRNTKADDFRLMVKATADADRDVHLRCILFDSKEQPFRTHEVVIDVTGTGTVTCLS